jgi:hypothetical protein
MKKFFILSLLIVAVSYGSQRVVVAEDLTATWCTYCPGAARGLEENYERDYDSVVVIAYHSSTSDPFYTAEAGSRASYYNLTGYPTTWFDGTISEIGGLHNGTMYSFYRHHITARLGVSSPLEITLVCNYDSITNTGTVAATILNTSGSSLSGNLHFVVIENNIIYNWQGMTQLEFLMRDMLPDASGEAVTIPASDTIIRSREFTIGTTWNELNCKIVVFVQAASREIYQGEEISLMQQPKMEYCGMSLIETNGNGNNFAEPGESMEIKALGKNLGDGIYTAGTSIQCSDSYVTITGSTPATVSIGPGDADTVITFAFDISASCPDPHQVNFELNLGSHIDTIPFIVTTTPGFADDIESGQGGWLHSGTSDHWHITEHKSNSPTHSWYCGVEGSWQYTNENDAVLVSPYFVSTPDSSLCFYHQYSLETSWDYGYVEVDNGSGWWQTLTEINGTQSSWIQDSYSLNRFNGQTVRIRFRFISDYSTTQEGWYVDDIRIPMFVGINAANSGWGVNTVALQVYPNPFSRKIEIRCQTGNYGETSLKIYNASGRVVKQLIRLTNGRSTIKQISWDGTNERGQKLAAGVYFIRLKAEGFVREEKVILCR